MAEQRKKSASLLLRTEGKSTSLELFPSDQWPDEAGGEGLHRVRVDDQWHCPTGKYSFLTLSAIGELVASLLAGGGVPPDAAAPYLPYKADVKAHTPDAVLRGNVKVAPYQKRDGRWYCQVWVMGGPREFLCDDVSLMAVRR